MTNLEHFKSISYRADFVKSDFIKTVALPIHEIENMIGLMFKRVSSCKP